ncbi:MAG: glycoside hydrolase family 127 protein [Lentisphaerae bacterium]|nr:glycoside hydrolase family 127 protein [Lentisphaerota bacterium]
MKDHVSTRSAAPAVTAVTLTGGFWQDKQRVNRDITLPIEYDQCKKTGRLDAWKLEWKPGQPNPPHIFWDSDVAKWIEAVGYSLAQFPDPALQALCDEVIDWMAAAQQPDGYLNVHFTIVEPDKRWSNLEGAHELYCAGHLMEAAVAYYQGTGKRTLLDVMCRYADYIAATFGHGPGQKRGYPGHEEIELALVKLAKASGNDKYLKLAEYFINERGQQPHYYDQERRARGDAPKNHGPAEIGPYAVFQAHLPVREQLTAEGHAVRACYLYAGMASVAKATGDPSLLDACRRLWDNISTRRMYITGGVGSSRFSERFTFDYDLPNEEAYAETCAAIALVFFAHNMLECDPDSRYADVMERALYNSVISGVSLDGRHFFYDNLLASHPEYHKFSGQKSPRRQEWFGCACCPPNIARVLASIGSYFYTSNDEAIWAHSYASCDATFTVAGQNVRLSQQTNYPWDGDVAIGVHPDQPCSFALALRIPDWCRQATLKVNGKTMAIPAISERGYAVIRRQWQAGDKVELSLAMAPERIYAHPSVRHDAGRVALQRGPVVYCLEEMDNGPDLADLRLPPVAELDVHPGPADLGGVPVITGPALRRDKSAWDHKLYAADNSHYHACTLTAIPYFLWANRAPGEMIIWILE